MSLTIKTEKVRSNSECPIVIFLYKMGQNADIQSGYHHQIYAPPVNNLRVFEILVISP